jgi:hypothetical protein
MKKYIIIDNKQDGGGGNVFKTREHNSGLNVYNLAKCKENVYKFNMEDIYKKIGSGFQSVVYLLNDEKCGSIVIKKYFKNKIHEMNKETKSLLAVKELIMKNISPHYIYMYEYDNKNGLILLEYVDGDIKKLYDNFSIFLSDEFIYSFFFQILYGIQCEYEICNILHHDVLPNNILKKSINKNRIFVYTVNKKKYYIPTYGNLFVISDYGRSYKIDPNKTKNYDFHDFMTGILSLYAKHLVINGYGDIETFYKVVSKKKMEDNNINLNNKIREVITDCLKKKLFDYKKYYNNYNVIDIILKIIKYDKIVDVFENLFNTYNNINNKNLDHTEFELAEFEPVEFI